MREEEMQKMKAEDHPSHFTTLSIDTYPVKKTHPPREKSSLKILSLLLLVLQTVGAIFLLRISRTRYVDSNTPYLITTAVFLSEIIKLLGSFLIVLTLDHKFDIKAAIYQVYFEVFANFTTTLRVGIPALLYTLQNNLLFIALSHLSAAVYQVTYQLKILTTAMWAILLLKKQININQWISLFSLTVGVVLLQIKSNEKSQSSSSIGNSMIGLAANLSACVTSGFAGVYFEKILKQHGAASTPSIWIRNIQLALIGSILSYGAIWLNDGTAVTKAGLFQGYNVTTWLAILIQSAGGLIVALVLKYADNILKCFANAVAIILSCALDYSILHEYRPSYASAAGIALVVAATYAYGTNLDILAKFRQPGTAVIQSACELGTTVKQHPRSRSP